MSERINQDALITRVSQQTGQDAVIVTKRIQKVAEDHSRGITPAWIFVFGQFVMLMVRAAELIVMLRIQKCDSYK